VLTSRMRNTGSAPLQEFGGVVEPERRVIILDIVRRQEFVHLFQLGDVGVGGDTRDHDAHSPGRSRRYPASPIQIPWGVGLVVA